MVNKLQTEDRAHQTRNPLSPAIVANTLEKGGIDLTEKQFIAVLEYLNGKSKTAACEAAGLAPIKSWSLFRSAKVQAAMGLILERFLLVDAAPAALRTLFDIVQDAKAAPGTRVQAANSLLDRAGFDNKRLSKADGDKADLHTMTADELRAEIVRLEREQEARMKDVSGHGAPDSEPVDRDAIDFP